jgi:hypothetical protein
MKNPRRLVFGLMVVSGLAIATSAIAAPISVETFLGATVSGATAVTGTTTISPLGALGSRVVGAGPEFGFCVGPNGDGCISSGLSGAVDVSATAVAFSFFGSTNPATGSFIFTLSSAAPIFGGVTLLSGGIPGFTFGLTSASPTSLVFTGTPTGGIYSAIGGSTVTFGVASVPEPGTLFLLGLGLVTGSRALRRRRQPQA